MNDLFANDINTRAAAYADRHAPDGVGRWIWQKIADAYVEGAASQRIIDSQQLTQHSTSAMVATPLTTT